MSASGYRSTRGARRDRPFEARNPRMPSPILEAPFSRFPIPPAALASRRRLLAAAALLPALPSRAQAWPERPIRFVVPFAPGGANDLMGRAAAEGASKLLGQPVIVENRPGAGGNVGSAQVARATPDGYTFLVSAAGVLSNPMIRRSNPYRDTDLVPVAMIALAPSVIVVARGAPWRSLAELVEASRQGQGLHFATAGTGSTPHFVSGMLNAHHGANLLPVPFKSGAEAASAVLGGHVAATSEASIVSLPHLKEGGKFRALATTWVRRMAVAPELPTAIEQGFAQVRIAHWAGVHAPAGVPAAILDRVAAAVDGAMRQREIIDRLVPMGIEPVGGTRAAFEQFVLAERGRLAEVVKAAGMRED
jgi:tripartite-type tricarboxylate transporter receptor subunit TctC